MNRKPFLLLVGPVRLALAVLTLLAGCVLAGPVQAQNLYEADAFSNSIIEFTPSVSQSTFASGLIIPAGLAFGPALPSTTPEPAAPAVVLMGSAVLGLWLRRSRQKIS